MSKAKQATRDIINAGMEDDNVDEVAEYEESLFQADVLEDERLVTVWCVETGNAYSVTADEYQEGAKRGAWAPMD